MKQFDYDNDVKSTGHEAGSAKATLGKTGPSKAVLGVLAHMKAAKEPGKSQSTAVGPGADLADEGHLAAAEELLEAIHAKDPSRMVKAHKTFLETGGYHFDPDKAARSKPAEEPGQDEEPELEGAHG